MSLIYNFDKSDEQHINQIIGYLDKMNISRDDVSFSDHSLLRLSFLPDSTKNLLNEMSNDPFCDFLLIKGIEFETPDTEYKKTSIISELFLASVAHYLGSPVNDANQRDGQIIHDIFPKIADREKPVGTNSEEFLFWHTENAHAHPLPAYVLLACLRGDKNAHTLLADITKYPFSEGELSLLREDKYTITSDLSYSVQEQNLHSIYSDRPGPCFRFDPLYTKTNDKAALSLLSNMSNHFNENAQRITLEAGDVLIINNNICCHARTKFKSNYDGKDRWIQRAIVNNEVRKNEP